MRLIALGWIGAIGVLLWAVWSGTINSGFVPVFGIGIAPVLLLLFLYPFFPAGNPTRIGSSISRRDILMFSLALILVVVALPSIFTNYLQMSDDPVPDAESISVDDYEITYAEEVQHGRLGIENSGVIVVNERREIWTAPVDESDLKDRGRVTVPVGGIGWRETVTAERQGWDVIGNGSAYAVDLIHDGQTIRAFRSDPAEARVEIANKSVAVEAVDERFLLNVTRNGTSLGTAVIPPTNGSTTIGTLAFETADIGGTPSVFARENGTRVLIAREEQFD
jgi:hypothetical protein